MRTDILFGKNVNVVGNVSADLVLESLGKIYIKSRNKAQTLDEIISSLITSPVQEIANNTIVIEDLEDLKEMVIKDGAFVYNKDNQILYIQIDGELVELISVTTTDTRYVKKTGDTMTGPLYINTREAPLKVVSSRLIKNLNSEYLNGLPSDAYAIKNKNEHIGGSWTFKNDTIFKDNAYFHDTTLHYKDSLHNGSIGTPNFTSGFGGYGWRIDAESNTLTIDYIVVRKAMYVYELVVNKISATNGSLWVTNASKVEVAYNIPIINNANVWNALQPNENSSDSDTLIRDTIFGLNNYGAVIVTNQNISQTSLTETQLAGNISNAPSTKLFVNNLKGQRVFVCTDKDKLSNFTNGTTYTFQENSGDCEVFQNYSLFDYDFDVDVEFPIVHYQDTNYKYNNAGMERQNVYGNIKYVKTYYKYFGLSLSGTAGVVFKSNFYIVKFDTDNLPVFKPGDILRCQKFEGTGIKYYDAVVINQLKESLYIIQLANNIFDYTTTIEYDDNLDPKQRVETSKINENFYNTSTHSNYEGIQGIVQEGDSLVQIGNLWDVTRQNAVYLTSSDDGAPYIDVIAGVNRPDYSVIYNVPTYQTIKLYKGGELPYTGQYYIQNNTSTMQYIVAYKEDSQTYSVKLGKKRTRIILWYKDANGNINQVPFDELTPAIEATIVERIRLEERLLDDSEIVAINAVINNIRNQSVASEGDIKALFMAIYPSMSSSTLDGYYFYYLRAYPDRNTKLLIPSEDTPLELESESQGNTTVDDAFCLTIERGTLNGTFAKFTLEDDVRNKIVEPTRTTKSRFGKLDGIVDDRFPVDRQPYGYGLYGENVFLTGEFVLHNGKNVADFGKDILSLRSSLTNLALSNDTIYKSVEYLFQNTPSYGDLQQTGIFLGNNQMVLLGDRISIITKMSELPDPVTGTYGEMPTALFEDGKINAKFIATQVVRSNVPLYKTTVLHTAKEVPLSSVTLYNGSSYYTYTGDSLVYEYREPVDYKQYMTKYIRRYYREDEECWLYTDIYGNPKKNVTYYYELTNCTPTEYTEFNYDPSLITVTIDSPKFISYNQNMYIKSIENSYQFVQYKYYTDENTYTQYTWNVQTSTTANNTELNEQNEPITNNTGYVQYTAFKKDLLDVVLWSLNIDGTGNLGGDGIYWDSNGILNVSGIVNAQSGKIGNISIKDNCLYKNMNSNLETLTSFYLGGSDGSERLELTKWTSLNSCETGTIETRTLLNSSQLEITSGKSMESSSNGVQLTSQGLVWKHEGIPITASSILFSIVLIPIKDYSGLWLPQIRTNYASFTINSPILGNYQRSPFSNINIYMYHPKSSTWGAGDGGGIYLIYFPELDNAIYDNGTEQYSWGSWMYDKIMEGRVIFQVTGLGEKGVYNNISFQDTNVYHEYANIYDYFDFNNESVRAIKANIQSYSFGAGKTTQYHGHSPGELSLDRVKHDYNICYFSRPSYTIYGNPSSDPNEQGNHIMYSVSNNQNSNNDLWWTYNQLSTEADKLRFRRLGLFGPDQSLDYNSSYPTNGQSPTYTDVFYSYTYENENAYPNERKSFIRGIKNYIRINTADDDSTNSGGFALTAFYLNGLNINNSPVTATIKS